VNTLANGSICHIEIFSKDLKGSKKFYEDVFNWKITVGIEGMPDYATFMDTEEMGGGFTPDVKGIIFYIEADDIEGTLKKIESAGGKVEIPKTMISEEIGYFAIFTDPSGTKLGLWGKK